MIKSWTGHSLITCSYHAVPHPQDLIADLKYELTGKFERLIVNLMRPLAYCDAKEIKDAISVRSMGLSLHWCIDVGSGKVLGYATSFRSAPANPANVSCFKRQPVLEGFPGLFQLGR